MKFFLSLFIIFLGYTVPAQTDAITGVVIDADSKAVVGACNVFISKTSNGVTTDAAGKFSLYNIAGGKSLQLVVSNIGYETFTYNFSSAQLPLNLKISLNRKIVQLPGIVVIPEDANGWQKWEQLFRRGFIGESENAQECSIENIDILKFRNYSAKKILEVTADGLLIINNNRLGYTIKYQLEKFEYDYKNQKITYIGYPLFEEMKFDYPTPPRYARLRLKAYNGSMMHFIRSLCADKLAGEGFEVKRMERSILPDTIKNKGQMVHMIFIDSAGNKIKPPPYIIRKRMEETFGKGELNRDSLLFKGTDSVRDILSFNDYLSIRYLRERENAEYSNSIYPQKSHKYQLTTINIVNEEKQVHVNPDGYYYPGLDLLIEGYMGWEKIGDQLPLDYTPGN